MQLCLSVTLFWLVGSAYRRVTGVLRLGCKGRNSWEIPGLKETRDIQTLGTMGNEGGAERRGCAIRSEGRTKGMRTINTKDMCY